MTVTPPGSLLGSRTKDWRSAAACCPRATVWSGHLPGHGSGACPPTTICTPGRPAHDGKKLSHRDDIGSPASGLATDVTIVGGDDDRPGRITLVDDLDDDLIGIDAFRREGEAHRSQGTGWRAEATVGVVAIEHNVDSEPDPHGQFGQGVDQMAPLARQVQMGPRGQSHVVTVNDQQHAGHSNQEIRSLGRVLEHRRRQHHGRPSPR